MPFQYPILQPPFILLQRQVPVLRLTKHGCSARERRLWIDQLPRTQCRSAFFTLIAVGIWMATLRAGADDVAVSEEYLRLVVVILLRNLFRQQPFIVQCE